MRRTSYFGAVSGRPSAGAVPLRPHRPLFSPRETGPAIESAPPRRSKSDSDIADSSPEATTQAALERTNQSPARQLEQPELDLRTGTTPEFGQATYPQSRTIVRPEIRRPQDGSVVGSSLPPVRNAVSQTDVPTKHQDEPLAASGSQSLSPASAIPER